MFEILTGVTVSSFFLPLIPLFFGLFMFNIVDIYIAISLARRVQEDMILKNIILDEKKIKFQLKKALKSLDKIISMCLILLVAHILDVIILKHLSILHLAAYSAGVIAIFLGRGILANASSCNDEKWAKFLQKVLEDKTKKYYNINLKESKN